MERYRPDPLEARLTRAARSLETSRRTLERAKIREEKARSTLLAQMALIGNTQLVVGAYRLILEGETLSVERLSSLPANQLTLPEFPPPPSASPTPITADDVPSEPLVALADQAMSVASLSPASFSPDTPALYERAALYQDPNPPSPSYERSRQVRFLAPEDASFLSQLEALLERARALLPDQYRAPEPGRPLISGPTDVAALLQPRMAHLPQEQLRLLTLTVKHTLLGEHLIAQGSLSSASVRPADIFRVACLDNAAAIIVAHNHPSGDPSPSAADVTLTRTLREIGDQLSLPLLDHVIVASRGHVSLRERGIMG